MILKKPYGMLIKNFRKIHIILTILTIFISIEAHNILNFFNEYVANNYTNRSIYFVKTKKETN